MQFSLISLIPGLLRRLEDCADPEFDSYERNLVAPASLRTSERSSCRYNVLQRKSVNAHMISTFLHGITITAVCIAWPLHRAYQLLTVNLDSSFGKVLKSWYTNFLMSL